MKRIQSQLAATKHESMQGVYICGNNYVYICVASITRNKGIRKCPK